MAAGLEAPHIWAPANTSCWCPAHRPLASNYSTRFIERTWEMERKGREKREGKKTWKVEIRNPTDPVLTSSPAPCLLYDFEPQLHLENGNKNTSLTWPLRVVMKIKQDRELRELHSLSYCHFTYASLPPWPNPTQDDLSSFPQNTFIKQATARCLCQQNHSVVEHDHRQQQSQKEGSFSPGLPLPPFYCLSTNRDCFKTQFWPSQSLLKTAYYPALLGLQC